LPSKTPSLRVREAVVFALPLASLIVIWQLVASLDLIRILPFPADVGRTLVNLCRPTRGGTPILLAHLGASLFRVGIGFSLAMAVGVPVGLLMGINKHVNDLLHPVLSLLMPVPTLAWVPMLLILWGLGDRTIVAAIFLGGFFSIAYNTAGGVRGIDRDLIRAAYTMGASKWTLFSRVLLPGSMVSVLTGLRLAVGYSWRALVGAEMLAAAGWGLGYLVFAARAFSAANVMFAGLIVIMVAGYLMERYLVGPLEKRTVQRWGVVRA